MPETQATVRVAEHRLLPADESWSPRTWAHFRYRLLRHLQKHGARTVEELEAESVEMLLTPLSREELIAVLESGRRRGLVEPTPHRISAVGENPGQEWQITPRGATASRSPVEWVAGSLGSGMKFLPALFGLLTAVGVSAVVAKELHGISLFAGVMLCVGLFYLLFIAIFLAAWLWSRNSGATAGFLIADEWTRFERTHPDWHSKLAKPFPRRKMEIIIAVAVVGLALAYFAHGLVSVLGAAGFLAGFIALYILLLSWNSDRYDWHGQELKRRKADAT
jgi:hypothetical protein